MRNRLYEKCKYLFVDIEWNQIAGTTDIDKREPIQIGIIETDEKLERQKLLSESIRLKSVETLTDETCKLVHVRRESIMQAKTEKEVFEKVKQSFPTYDYIVVWTKDTYEIFKSGMDKTDISMPRHRVLVLQDILNLISMNCEEKLGFEAALLKAGIQYEADCLHYSKYDVRYLLELFKTMYFKYAALTEREGCVINIRTKVIHSPDCRCIKEKNCEIVTNARRMIFYGYRPCKLCESKQDWRKFHWSEVLKKKRKQNIAKNMRKLPLTDDNIQRICRHFGIKCNIVSDVIFITTSIGYWRIYFTDNKVDKVFHGNYRINRTDFFKKKKKCNEGFHKQDISMENLYDVVRYIYYHDKNMFKNRKSRIDKLFDKIEQERRIKEM